MTTLTGRCLCEKVSYEITGALGPIYHCHCSKCRRWHGAAFRTRTSIKKSQFRWLSGEALAAGFNSSEPVTKHFCSNCGSALISTYTDKPDYIGIPLGALEQAPANKPEGHIFVGSKSPWYVITDGLPQYQTWPDGKSDVHE